MRDTFDRMMGMGRTSTSHRILGVESADPVLSLLAALGLGQVAGTALVIDMCRDLTIRAGRTLADIAEEGPALGELSPGRSGVALLSSGSLAVADCVSVIEALAPNWPAMVIRSHPGQWEGPTVPVRALLPGFLQTTEPGPAVWQPLTLGLRPPGPGPVLPRLRSTLARRLLSGRADGRARWVRAWGPIWGLPWA
jgi:hypothetical protein